MIKSFAEMKRWERNTTFCQGRDGGCYNSEITLAGSPKIGAHMYDHYTDTLSEFCYLEMNRWKWNKQNTYVPLSLYDAILRNEGIFSL